MNSLEAPASLGAHTSVTTTVDGRRSPMAAIDEMGDVLADFEAIQATLKGGGGSGKTQLVGADATVVGWPSAADASIATVARSWTGSSVTQEAAQVARREAHELLASWSAEANATESGASARRRAEATAGPEPELPARRRVGDPPPPQPTAAAAYSSSATGPPQPMATAAAYIGHSMDAAAAYGLRTEPSVSAGVVERPTVERSTSPTLSSSSTAPSTGSWESGGPELPAGPDPVELLESRRQANATLVAQHRLAAAAEWQQRAVWQQRELEQEQEVKANQEQRRVERQRLVERQAGQRKVDAHDRRWARTKAKAASALAEEAAARAGREESRWQVKAKQASNAVATARDCRLREQADAESTEKRRREEERAKRKEATRRWEESRRRAEDAAREHSVAQAMSEQRRRANTSRTDRRPPPPPTVREAWRPPLPYHDAVAAQQRIPGDNRDSIHLADGFSTRVPAVVEHVEVPSQRVGPDVRVTWSRYSELRHNGPSAAPRTVRALAEVAGRQAVSAENRGHPPPLPSAGDVELVSEPSPIRGWGSERSHAVPVETAARGQQRGSISGAGARTLGDSTQAVRRDSERARCDPSSHCARATGDLTRVRMTLRRPFLCMCRQPEDRPSSPMHFLTHAAANREAPGRPAALRGPSPVPNEQEERGPSPLPHEHVRSPAQSKPGRGAPFVTSPSPDKEELEQLRGRIEGGGRSRSSGSRVFMPVPALAAGSESMTDQLIDLAYKITDNMDFKEPPGTPRRPGVSHNHAKASVHAGRASQLQEIYVRADRDGDGRLTRAELILRLRKDEELRQLLKLPAHVGDGERDMFEAVFQGMDVDDDRCVSAEEFVRYLGKVAPVEVRQPQGRAQAQALNR